MRQLIAGNWKMNRLQADAAALAQALGAGPADWSASCWSARPPSTWPRWPGAGGIAGRRRRPGLPPGQAGRAHRRHLRRHAARCRGELGDPRAFGAPAGPWGDRRAGPRKGRWRRWRPGSRRSSASARPRISGRAARRPRWSAGRSPAACRRDTPGSWPTNRSGRSAPARSPPSSRSQAMHAFIREELARQFGAAGRDIRILYGGSVKPGNAASLLAIPEVGGALIGGASLNAADFLAIARAAQGG